MKRGLQAILALIGAVATVLGSLQVVFGATLIPGINRVPANLDSELRFFAVWYAVVGVMLLGAIPRVESAGHVVRAISVAFGVAGLARLLSMLVVEAPDTIFVVLMALELAIPIVVIPWQSRVARLEDATQ